MNWKERLALLFGVASPLAIGSGPAWTAELPTGPQLEPANQDRDAWTYTDPAQRQRFLQLAAHSSHSSHSSHASHYSGSGGHSSHASHASHASHYSGSGGYIAPPPPPTVSPQLYAPPVYPRRQAPETTWPSTPPPTQSPQLFSPPVDTHSRRTAPTNTTQEPPSSPVPLSDPYSQQPAVIAIPAPQSAPSGAPRFSQTQIRIFVQRLQIALLAQGYDPGPADGVVGVKTKEALKAYQAAAGLPPTGYMDVETLRRLGVIQ
jgi:His-Xaa-Ser repeat protein HxsA